MDTISMRKNEIRASHCDNLSNLANDLLSSLADSPLKRCLEVTSERGASTWLTALPLRSHGFALHKGAFWDTLC